MWLSVHKNKNELKQDSSKHTKGNLDSVPAHYILYCLIWQSATANLNSHTRNESSNQIKGVDISMF